MIDLPMLAIPNFEKTFIIEFDVSRKGVGALLLQDGRPVAYMSIV